MKNVKRGGTTKRSKINVRGRRAKITAGEHALRNFKIPECKSCGYSHSILSKLPKCPMCKDCKGCGKNLMGCKCKENE